MDRFIVIDDKGWRTRPVALFQPPPKTGLTEELIDAAADYLDGKTGKDMRPNELVRVVQNLGLMLVGHKR